MAIELPKIRQVGTGSDRYFQWMFPGDGQWRNMVPREGISLKDMHPGGDDKKPYDDVDFDTFLKVHGDDMLPQYLQDNVTASYMMVLKELWADVTGLDPQPYEPQVFAGGNKGFLWDDKKKTWSNRTYTGDGFKVDTQDAVTWNWDGREGTYEGEKALLASRGGDPNDIGPRWNESSINEMVGYMTEYTEDVSREHNWHTISGDRGYTDIDWSDPNAAFQFLSRAQDDLERGRIYTDQDKYKGMALARPGDPPLGPAVPPGGVVGDGADIGGRKIVGEYGTQSEANAAAANIQNSTVVPSGGKFVVTIPPGQGGWESKEEAEAWLRKTSGDDAGNFEVAPGGQGQWFIREKAAATPGQFDTRAEAEQWLKDTGGEETPEGFMVGPTGYEVVAGPGGKWVVREKPPTRGGQFANKAEAERWLANSGDPEGFEAVPGPEGKWVVREKRPDKAYSTPTTTTTAGVVVPGTPGDMFEPTVTEDPTGRKFGLTAGGDIKDFGYGMAGDITQEELAGYQPPHRSLDMIVAKAIEQGNWELARGVQAFIDRPTETDLLQFAAQYAESPADLAVLSAIARGETMVQPGVALPEGMGAGMGQATRIGAPGAEYASAYKQFKDAMDMGFDPTLPENQEALNDLFKPENDPVYQATQELANKYETEIGALRDQIADINAKATERIENTQTSTLNMMSGLFSDTLGSFKDLMQSQNDASSEQITNWQNLYNLSLKGGDSGDDVSGDTGGSVTGDGQITKEYWHVGDGKFVTVTGTAAELEAMIASGEYKLDAPVTSAQISATGGDRGNWFWDTVNNKWLQYNQDGTFDLQGGRYHPEETTDQHLGGVAPSTVTGDITVDDGDGDVTAGIPTDVAEDYQTYSGIASAIAGGAHVDPSLQAQFADIVGDAPGQRATESQFAYQTSPTVADTGQTWTSGDKSWQAEYFEPLAEKEQEAAQFKSLADFEGAGGGVVQGPTMALLGEKEPEFIVPFSKVDEFKQGFLPMGRPRQTRRGSTVANFEDSIPRFANGGMVTGPRFGGVTASQLQPYGETGAFVTPGTRKELDLGAGGQYGEDGISRAPRIGASDFESLFKQYTTRQTPIGPQMLREGMTREEGLARIPEYELRQRLGASEFAGTNPTQHPIGIQQLMAGRPIARPRSLMTAANMPKPSGQALRNMLPSETAYYQKMGRMAGIPQEELEREMRSVMPGGTRRTPLRMGARRVRQA